jgi:serine/threonine protein kinase
MPVNGQTIGPYELERLIGEGGIGHVYAAQDRVLGRQVAIKMLRPELSRDRNFVERFYVEAKSLANLNHTNITTLYQLHADGDDAYMVMELVHGVTLDALLKKALRLNLRDALAVLAQAIPGLRYAHRRGVIHRDIKLTNLMITEDGVLKIMDFGIARVRGSQHLTQVGEFCGTYLYAPPEQIKGEEVDERGDLYSLAIVFYRMLAGEAPFISENEYALMTAQLQQAPPPLLGRVPEVDAATEEALMRALAKRPEDRFGSVEEFGRAVGAMALRGESVEILQQLYERIIGGDDGEKTRVVVAQRPTAHSEAPPMARESRPSNPAMAPNRPPAPELSGASQLPPGAAAASERAPLHRTERRAGRRWALAGVIPVFLLLIAGSYYLLAAGRVGSSSDRPQASTEPVAQRDARPHSESAPRALTRTTPEPLAPAASITPTGQVATSTPAAATIAPVPTTTANRPEEPLPPSRPPAVGMTEEAVPNTGPAVAEAAAPQPAAAESSEANSPAAVGTLGKPDAPPATAAKTDGASQILSAATPGSTSVLGSPSEQTPPAQSPTATPNAVAASIRARSTVQPGALDYGKQSSAGAAASAGSDRQNPAGTEEPAAAAEQVHVAAAEPPLGPAAPASATPLGAGSAGPAALAGTDRRDPVGTEKAAATEPRVHVAAAEPPAAPSPPTGATPPPAAVSGQPEGPPDLEGRVTGLKGLGQIELDKRKWIKIYGITDLARGSREQQHTTALIGYLKPSHNHLVCYRKPADTYRCYSDGKDIAGLALLDRLVQLTPAAPAEYRELLAHHR